MRSFLFIFLVSILCTNQLTTEDSIHSTSEHNSTSRHNSTPEFPKIQDVERVLLENEGITNKFQFKEKTVKIANILVVSTVITTALAYLFYSIYNLVIEYKHQ